MRTPRRVFIKQLATSLGAAFILRGAAQAQETPRPSRDSKLMGDAKFVDVEGARTRYFEGGQGEALVLVHGGQWPATASADGWRPIFDHLAARFRVYAFDKLGMGFTDNPKRDADYSMDAIIQHAYGFIRAVGISLFSTVTPLPQTTRTHLTELILPRIRSRRPARRFAVRIWRAANPYKRISSRMPMSKLNIRSVSSPKSARSITSFANCATDGCGTIRKR